MSNLCAVRGCQASGTIQFEVTPEPLTATRMVCEFHHVALTAGTPWANDIDFSEILMGEDIGLDVIGFTVSKQLNKGAVELRLGQGGVEVSSMVVRITANMAQRLCDAITDEDHHPDAFRTTDT